MRILPGRVREGILRGMLGADVLGFHSQMWAENFLMSARSLPGVRADLARSRLSVEGRQVAVRIHPISIDAVGLRQEAAGPEVTALRRELNRWRGDTRLILRVDRLELTKNIVRGFQAYALFLRTHPEWHRRVRFLALLSPSRMDVPDYLTYGEECVAEAERVNTEFGDEEWQPVEVRVKDDYLGALAAYGISDVLLVNPIYDGMNLVAMEGPLLNRRAGVLVLSRNAGAYWRLGKHALAVNPFDLRETAEALYRALEMPREERVRRARGLSRLVLSNPAERWVRTQLEDLERARIRRRTPSPEPAART
jgi:trehalose 6-phosphate synthase